MHDPLSLLHQQHERVSEWLAVMCALSGPLLREGASAQAARLAETYRTVVLPHFDFEERLLFPALVELGGDPELVAGLGERLGEHAHLRVRIAALLDELSEAAPSGRDAAAMELLARRARLIGDMLALHAAREDALVVPRIEARRAEVRAAVARLAAAQGAGEKPSSYSSGTGSLSER